MKRMAPHWAEFETFFAALDDSIRDTLIRARLLMAQFDGLRARRLRSVGRVKTWPLDPRAVRADRLVFDREREEQLARSRARVAAARAGGSGLTTPEPRP